jgi:2-keto-4-pentenoate hydratase
LPSFCSLSFGNSKDTQPNLIALNPRLRRGQFLVVRPSSLAEAYGVQDRLAIQLGLPTVAWKIGLAAPSGYLGAGLSRPIFGRIFRPRCYRSGEAVPVPAGQPVAVELEIALVLAGTLDPGMAIDASLIQSAHLGFEIVCSRLPGRQGIGIPATVADNSVSHSVVLGGLLDLDAMAAIQDRAAIRVDGRLEGVTLSGDDLPRPFAVPDHLVSHLAERGQSLRRGDIIFTGTMTRPFEVNAPCELASAGEGPSLNCRLVPQD